MPGVKYALRREWAYLGLRRRQCFTRLRIVLSDTFALSADLLDTFVHPDLRKSLIQTKYSLKSRRNLRRADSDSADDDPRKVARKACVPNISKCARDPVLNGL